VERYLGSLRPRQLDEYKEAFREASGEEEPLASPEPKSNMASEESPVQRKAEPSSMKKAEEEELVSEEEDVLEDSTDPYTCQFCGKYDPSYTEEALDLHYWQECVMLMSCRECSQVIEISCLAEHYLEECEFQEKYTTCNVSGEVVLKDELSEWQASAECHPKTAGMNRCLLCHEDVGSGEEGWRKHLTMECRKNERLNAQTKK